MSDGFEKDFPTNCDCFLHESRRSRFGEDAEATLSASYCKKFFRVTGIGGFECLSAIKLKRFG